MIDELEYNEQKWSVVRVQLDLFQWTPTSLSVITHTYIENKTTIQSIPDYKENKFPVIT